MKSPKTNVSRTLILKDGWMVQASKTAKGDGGQVSEPGYKTQGWLPADLPSTVLGAQIDNKVYEDPNYSLNIRKLPGMNYNPGENFSLAPMVPDSPYASSWWFRKEFKIQKPGAKEHFRLHFDGVNFAANIWVNGQKIADREEVAGTY